MIYDQILEDFEIKCAEERALVMGGLALPSTEIREVSCIYDFLSLKAHGEEIEDFSWR